MKDNVLGAVRKMTRMVCVCMVLAIMATSCNGNDDRINVSPSQLYGTWKKVGTREYWSYHQDGGGAKWDETDGFSEDFPSYSYHWSISGDRLSYTTYGENIDVPITRTYTITEISDRRMVREEEIGVYTLEKVE